MAWQTRAGYELTHPTARTLTEETAMDLVSALTDWAAVGSINRDHRGGAITLTIDERNPVAAAKLTVQLLNETARTTIGPVTITSLEVKRDDIVDQENELPLYPEVVSYAEIADLGNVSRQAARKWADNPTFPPAVIETAQGPLRVKDAVITWISQNRRRPRTPNKELT